MAYSRDRQRILDVNKMNDEAEVELSSVTSENNKIKDVTQVTE